MRPTSLGNYSMGSMEKFLKAIDHMEFHPTLGKKRKEPVLNYISKVQRI